MKQLTISKDLKLPLEIVTQTVAILAKRRVGKSYTMRGMAEQFLELGQQVILVDPKGDQWGIRSSADGKKPGFSVLILGGEHGDLPLEVNGGELVAKLAVEERVSMLLDLSSFRKHEVSTFMAIFLENLYRLKAQERFRTPVMLIVDEADAIAPQKPQKGEERMLGAIEDIVRRGGQRGIGCMVVTQRSAVLNKNVLTQAQMLIVLRTIAPQDLAAMNAWIDVHGTAEERKVLMESLPSLPVGDAWFWSPGWPTAEGIFKLVHVLPIKTFDSAATPKPGERKLIPKNLAHVDLDALKTQMAATIEKAKADNPVVLKKRITELEKKLVSLEGKPTKTNEDDLMKAQQQFYKIGFDKGVEERDAKWGEAFVKLTKGLNAFDASINEILNEKPKISPSVLPQRMILESPASNFKIKSIKISPVQKKERLVNSNIQGDIELRDRLDSGVKTHFTNDPEPFILKKGSQRVLYYLHSVYPKEKSKAQLWIATGYSPGGGFDNFVYELTGHGLIIKTESGKFKAAFEVYREELMENFNASLDLWKAKMKLGSQKVLDFMLQNPEQVYTKNELAEATGYAKGGGFDNCIYELTGASIIKKSNGGFIINEEILDL